MTTEFSDNTTPSPAAANQSAMTTLLGMFVEPTKAFAAIKEKSMVWLPLALTLIGTAVLLMWYYQQVDIAWLQDKLLAGKDMEPAQRETAMKMMGRGTMQGIGLAGALLGIPILYALMAVYFTLVGKFADMQVTFGKWFAMVVWAGVPGLIAILLGFMQILLADHGQLAPNQLNPLSVNQIFFHLDMGARWAGVLDGINVTTLWSVVLMGIGVQTWGNKSRITGILIAAVPTIIILAISALAQGPK